MKTVDGLSGYDILKMPQCPIKLPTARSMTQARIDFEHLEDSIFEWYKSAIPIRDNKAVTKKSTTVSSDLDALLS